MDTRRKELGEFIQALRQRGTPEEFGFPSGARRRTQGLRREEVAQLAGISATWYTWIEQGREVNVSAETLERLASALKLSKSERAYLFDMADRRDRKRTCWKPTPRQKR
jgi:DNA-binding XRE family transcriptional regulator